MANDRRQRAGRAAERGRADQQLRLIYIGSGVVLMTATLAVVAGLFVTRYQPPRAHVLTVDGQSYQARDVAARGAHLAFFEDVLSSLSNVAWSTVDRLIEEAAFRSQAAQLVELVTEEDIRQELYIELDLASPLLELPLTADDAIATDATATPTVPHASTAGVGPQEFVDALTDLLRDADLDRDTYEMIVEARLYRERLQDHFESVVGKSGPQLSLQRIQVSTQRVADTVLEALAGGANFATLADEQSEAAGDGEGGDLGWIVGDLLDEDVRAEIDELGVGEHSVAISASISFDVYRVAEVAEDREYDRVIAIKLANLRFDEWLETAITAIEVAENLSEDEETWINDRVLASLTARQGG